MGLGVHPSEDDRGVLATHAGGEDQYVLELCRLGGGGPGSQAIERLIAINHRGDGLLGECFGGDAQVRAAGAGSAVANVCFGRGDGQLDDV